MTTVLVTAVHKGKEPSPYGWDLSPQEAIAKQKELALQVVLQPLPERFEVLAAADLAYLDSSRQLVAVIVTFRWPTLDLLESVHVVEPVRFPYVPGLLSFREIPPLLAAYQQLKRPPDVFLCDGQGLAHPRRLGLASHLGLCLQIPTVGCAKKRLCGEHQPLELIRGYHTPLYLNEEIVGEVLCSRTRVKPIFISPGHLADCDSSRNLVVRCLGRFRQPEPLRHAHRIATNLRRELAAMMV
jgi:deoxyribonuclease V